MRRSVAGLAMLAVAACDSAKSGGPGRAEALRPLAREVGAARIEYDEAAFRSFRKDGQLSSQVTMGGRTLFALTPPVPSSIAYELRLPEDPVLQVSNGAPSLGEDALRTPVVFEVSVESAGDKPTVVVSDRLRRRAANQWHDHEVDLTPWAGRNVTLRFSSRVADGNASAAPALVAWGDPLLADRAARRSE
ncbi:MAG TPA: hypothetical protein VIG29_14695, partial [Vicinamibacteria bacterium]